MPGWAPRGCKAASLGDHIWVVGVGPMSVLARVRLLESVSRRIAEKLDPASLSVGQMTPCFENYSNIQMMGRRKVGEAVTSCYLFVPHPAWAFVHILVYTYLQGGAIYSSCTPSPVCLLLSRLAWPSEAIWRH